MNYQRVATKEEVVNMSDSDYELLVEAELHMDPKTFTPYKILNGVRYDLEPLMENS